MNGNRPVPLLAKITRLYFVSRIVNVRFGEQKSDEITPDANIKSFKSEHKMLGKDLFCFECA